jgi:hypothetical protein
MSFNFSFFLVISAAFTPHNGEDILMFDKSDADKNNVIQNKLSIISTDKITNDFIFECKVLRKSNDPYFAASYFADNLNFFDLIHQGLFYSINSTQRHQDIFSLLFSRLIIKLIRDDTYQVIRRFEPSSGIKFEFNHELFDGVKWNLLLNGNFFRKHYIRLDAEQLEQMSVSYQVIATNDLFIQIEKLQEIIVNYKEITRNYKKLQVYGKVCFLFLSVYGQSSTGLFVLVFVSKTFFVS